MLILVVVSTTSACTNAPPTHSPEPAPQGSAVLRITVEAGAVDRLQTPVSFDLQHGPLNAALIGESGDRIPVQAGPDGRYWFILDSLGRGTARAYTVVNDQHSPDTTVTATSRAGQVAFSAGGRPLITYNFEPTPLPDTDVDSVYRRGGYIHPVFSPTGVQLTDDYPPNHLHHHGIWAAWTKTEFQGRTPDFWNVGDRTGTVEPVALDSVWSGPVFAGSRSRHSYLDLSAPTPTKALDESWTIRVFPALEDGIRVFDLVVTQTTADGAELHLPEYRYGGVGFRGHRQWDGEEHAFFLTSEGKDRSNGHATRARWCHIGGLVDGRLAGLAVLDHPQNFRSPQPVRIHPTEPFFNYAPSQRGDWTIGPADAYTARYRFITYDGEPDPEILDRLWNDFADPPVVLIDAE